MTAGGVLIFLVAAGAAAFVLAPLFRPPQAASASQGTALAQAQELTSQHEMALSALRDVEDDRATGKIDDKDYEDIKARLTSRAVEIMKRLDELGDPPAKTR